MTWTTTSFGDSSMRPSTSSVAITEGVRVVVASNYLAAQSSPKEKRYVFAYNVRIANESKETVQLQNRHWIITDADGKVQEVRGAGVVGVQPALQPGQSFSYTSGCILETIRGTMRGTYDFVRKDGEHFDVEIGSFVLELPQSLN